jgi:hypothetical protein
MQHETPRLPLDCATQIVRQDLHPVYGLLKLDGVGWVLQRDHVMRHGSQAGVYA